MAFTVQVYGLGGWIDHSVHGSFEVAVRTMEMVKGRIEGEEAVYEAAVRCGAFDGGYQDWLDQRDAEREDFVPVALRENFGLCAFVRADGSLGYVGSEYVCGVWAREHGGSVVRYEDLPADLMRAANAVCS